MAAKVDLQAAGVRVGRAEALLQFPRDIPLFQPTRDGRRFLVMEPEAAERELPMVVVRNWAAPLGK